MWWLLSCETVAPEPEVERSYDGPFQVESVVIDCDDANAYWQYDMMATGWGSKVTVEIDKPDPDAWSETHLVPEVDYDEGGDWSRWTLDLVLVGRDEQENDSSTAVRCVDKTFVTYAFHAWDWDGAYVECLTWGLDPEGVFPECANLGATGH